MGLYLRSRMPKANRLLLFFILAAFLLLPGHALAGPSAQDTSPRLYWIIGKLLDPQGQPIVEAHIQTMAAGSDQPLASTDSLEDGSWILTLPDIPAQQLEIDISHPHFSPYQLQFSPSEQDLLSQTGLYHTPDLTMNRRITGRRKAGQSVISSPREGDEI